MPKPRVRLNYLSESPRDEARQAEFAIILMVFANARSTILPHFPAARPCHLLLFLRESHPIHISKSAIAALTLHLAPSAIWRVMVMGAPQRRAR